MSVFDDIFGEGSFQSVFGRSVKAEAPIDVAQVPPPIKPEVVQRVTIQSLIDRKSGLVRIGGKCYRFKFAEVELTR